MTKISAYAPRSVLIAAAFLGLGIAIAALTTYICGRVRAGHEVNADLIDGRLTAQQILNLRFQRLRGMSDAMSGDPTFVGYVLEAATASNDPLGGGQGGSGSVKDLLAERQTQVGYDFGMVLDPNGGLVASTGSGEGDLAADPLFAAAMKTHDEKPSYWLRNGQLYQVVVSHLANRDQQAGYLVLALAVDQVQLKALQQGGNSEHMVFDNASGGYVPVAGTLTADEMMSIGKQLQTEHNLPQGAFNLSFAGRHWAAYVDPLGSAGDSGVLVTLVSYEQAMDGTYALLLLLLVEVLLITILAAAADFWLARRSPAWPTRPQ